MLKLILLSPWLIIWSVLELPRIKRDYSTKGVIYYILIMLLVLTSLSIYLLDINYPSFYQVWLGILKIFGISDPRDVIKVQ